MDLTISFLNQIYNIVVFTFRLVTLFPESNIIVQLDHMN